MHHRLEFSDYTEFPPAQLRINIDTILTSKERIAKQYPAAEG
jgi:hypothetical protein